MEKTRIGLNAGKVWESIVVNWRRLHTLLSMFAKCDYIQFSQIDMKYIEIRDARPRPTVSSVFMQTW